MVARRFASREAVTLVFEDLRPIIDRTANAFARRFNRDPEDARAEAYLIFLEIYRTFDPSQGELESRVGYLIRRRLLSTVASDFRAKWEHVELDSLPGHSPTSSPTLEFDRKTLSTDAWVLAVMVEECPDDLRDEVAMEADGPARRDRPYQYARVRTRLYRYCQRELLWDSRRIRRAVKRLRENVRVA